MEHPLAVFPGTLTVGQATESIRELVRQHFITYAYIIDANHRLVGLVTMRDLLLAERTQTLDEIMLRQPFALSTDLSRLEAMKLALSKHFPCYPVCDAAGVLVGLVWGHKLFEEQAIELSAQAGSMVGVEKEERIDTPVPRSFFFRHPWLQVNLVSTFAAAAVVGYYEHTIDRFVALAVFLPVMMSQASNTGCQSLAVTLRGITLGHIDTGRTRYLIGRESVLGLFNGALTGVTAGLGMLGYSLFKHDPNAWSLACITLVAMTVCCIIAGQVGAVTPLILKRLGADPATASSIFLTTITDVASMGFFLWLATCFLL